MAPRHESTLGINYPQQRDVPNKSANTWFADRKATNGAEDLWRIHDGIYDFTEFIRIHPGGQEWLSLTKGTDITEAFEAHHISTFPEELLSKFFVRNAKTPRSYPYTFDKNGFYKTLKENVRKALKDIPKDSYETSNKFTDGSLIVTFLFAILSVHFWSYICATISGIFLAFTVIAAHNYFHRKDNFRMYYFDLSFMSSTEWRVSHALSHHLYTNSVEDMEISMFEPIFEYMPKKKVNKYVMWLYAPLIWITYFHFSLIKRWGLRLTEGLKFSAKELIPLFLPIAMFLFTSRNILEVILMWNFIILIASTYFLFIGTNAAHHHPKIFHDGDKPREDNDWGLHQLDAVMDRFEINSSHWLILTNFGDHALHHMFPTFDHGFLRELNPVFEETAAKFGIHIRFVSQLELIKGQFLQLIREEPNPEPPQYNKLK